MAAGCSASLRLLAEPLDCGKAARSWCNNVRICRWLFDSTGLVESVTAL
jgi:hypothetical protein